LLSKTILKMKFDKNLKIGMMRNVNLKFQKIILRRKK